MKRPICALAAGVLFALSANAKEWYVDCHSTVAPATGTSEAPFTTIEAAVYAASDDDKIWVRPGEYVSDDAGYDSENDIRAVACLTKKVRLESTDGKEQTFIVGKFDNGGPGPNAVSGVWATKAGTVIKGFTIKGGASRTNGNSGNIMQNHGGGISYLNGSGKRDCYVVDCTVRDCKATRGGGVGGCTVMRTLFVNNTTNGGHGQAARHSNLYACIFIGNSSFANSGNYSSGASRVAADAASYVVNCTFVGNPAGGLQGGSAINISVANTVSTFSLGTPAPACESFYVSSGLKTTVSHCVFDGVRFQDGADNFSFADSVTNASPYQTISPFEGDFRIVKGGDCDGTGDPAAVDCTWVPEEFRGKDFYGNPLIVNGKCNVGAVAASAERKGGILVVKGEFANGAIVNGNGDYRNKVLYDKAAGIYVGSATWPRQVYVTAGEKQNGRPAIRFEMIGFGSVADNAAPSRFTDYDGGAWFMLPRETTRVFTGTIKYAAGIKYVNAETGVDDDEEGRGDSDAMPYKTIQKAHDKSATDWLVLAAPGDYKDGETVVNDVTTRVYVTKSVLIRAADRTARDRTILRGHRMPDKRDSFENGHIRPLRMGGGIHCAVQGFTITEGCTIANANSEAGCGGLVLGNGVRTQLLDCLLSDGRGSRAGAAQGVWAIRCVFTNNTCGGQCTARDATVSSCIFTENYNSSSWEVGVNTRVFNCSQYSSMMTGNNRDVAGSSAYIYNSIFTGGMYGEPFWDSVQYERQGCWSNMNAMDGVTKTDTLFVKTSGDFRLRGDSPAVQVGGSTECPLLGTEYFSIYTTDGIDGKPIVFTADGRPMPGAVQTVATVVQVQQAKSGEVAVSPAGLLDADGKAVVSKGDTITLTAQGSEKRKFLGFNVDGELVEQADKTYVWTAAEDSYYHPVVLSAAYNRDWYVNPDGQRFADTNDGWTPETARVTLKEAVKDAVPGDTVHLAAGTYDSGTATSYTPDGLTAHKTPNRVVVPEGVTLQGDGDPAAVIIKGVNGRNKKKDADAVRCAFLEKNARLKSLTVTDGSVAGGGSSSDIDDYGGGVCGRGTDTAFVEDCILTGNFGGRAGALAWGTMVRCRVVGNAATSTGACGRNVNLFGCFVDDNAGNEMLLDGMYVVDCTFGPGNGQAPKHTPASQSSAYKDAVIANCVILTPNKADGTGVVCNNISNCIVASGINVSSSLTSFGVVQTYSADDLKLDANGRPAKDSPVVDYGRIATSQDGTFLGATDLDGVPRALGAKQDLGCYEYDWRGDFAADVGTGFSVPAASVGIVETSGGVYVPGGTLELLRSADAKAATSMRGKVVVSGNGTLVVTVNGVEAASYAEGTHALKLYGEGAGDRVALTYVPGAGDTGGAMLSDFSGLARGMSILLR